MTKIDLQTALELHREGKFEEASTIYRALLADDPNHAGVLVNLASIALDQNQPEEAETLLLKALQSDPENAGGHLLLSRVQFLNGKHEPGYASIQRAFELVSDDEGVAAEYVSAMRRRYFTFNENEYAGLLNDLANDDLPASRYPRLAHLAFLRVARPEVIKRLVAPPNGNDDGALPDWMATLGESEQLELRQIAEDFGKAMDLFYGGEAFHARKATVTLRSREGSDEVIEVASLTDADSTTHTMLEIVTHDGLQFVPFSELSRIDFNQPSAATGCVLTYRDGRVASGFVPLFYLFTEFAEQENVRTGRSTLLRPIIPHAPIGVGMRVFRAGENLLPCVRVISIDFDV